MFDPASRKQRLDGRHSKAPSRLCSLTAVKNDATFAHLMRSHAAPAGRGSSFPQLTWRARHSGLPALLYLTLATSLPPALAGHAVASEFSAPQHQLRSVSSEVAPALALPDLGGLRLDLEQLADKIVLVHFFATWCEPCRPELISLSKLLARTSNTLSVVAVSVAEPRLRLERFFEKSPVGFPVLLDIDRAAAKAWGVSVLPTTFVLDPRGAVRLHVEGDIDWSRPDVLARLDELNKAHPSINSSEENSW